MRPTGIEYLVVLSQRSIGHARLAAARITCGTALVCLSSQSASNKGRLSTFAINPFGSLRSQIRPAYSRAGPTSIWFHFLPPVPEIEAALPLASCPANVLTFFFPD